MSYLFLFILFCQLNAYVLSLDIMSSLTDFFFKYTDDAGEMYSLTADNHKNIEQFSNQLRCNDTKMMYELAKISVISPERIIQLIFIDDLNNMCRSLRSTIKQVSKDIADCIPPASDNLYWKLFQGIITMNNELCGVDGVFLAKLDLFSECTNELQEEFIECEGPLDWIEKTNTDEICRIFQDNIDCIYVKSAELCGISVANRLAYLSKKIIDSIIQFRCTLEDPPIVNATMILQTFIESNATIKSKWNFLIIAIALVCKIFF